MMTYEVFAKDIRQGDLIVRNDDEMLSVREVEAGDGRRRESTVRVLLDRGLHMPTAGEFWHTFNRLERLTIQR